jgi:O-antigen/teichoic acid export membrane protein
VIVTFLSLKVMRIGGMALSYAALVWFSRTQGTVAVGQYLVLLNSAIVVGTLAALGLPMLVQRLSVRLEVESIGAGTREALADRWPFVIVVAGLGTLMLAALDADVALSPLPLAMQALAALAFATTLILLETMRVATGPRRAEFQRNVTRPALILAFVLAGVPAMGAVLAGTVGALAVALWQLRAVLRQRPLDAKQATYVAERARDLPTISALGGLGLLFGAMDVVIFGMLADPEQTGLYGAGSRYGMLVNVALLAGNAQMVRHLAKVAARDNTHSDLAALRRQVRMVRFGSTALITTLVVALPVYAWIMALPLADLWPYFAIVGGSFWLQGLLGPVNMFLMQSHEAGRLIVHNLYGMLAFALVGVLLYLQGTSLAVPVGAAVGANLVKILSWLHIGRSRGLWI